MIFFVCKINNVTGQRTKIIHIEKFLLQKITKGTYGKVTRHVQKHKFWLIRFKIHTCARTHTHRVLLVLYSREDDAYRD